MVVFDLDDTLYLERDFALSGFAAAGAVFERETGVRGLAERCAALFRDGERARVFDRALAAVAPRSAAVWTPRLVDIYRGHVPRIALAPDAARWLAANAGWRRIGIITDGSPATQRAKITALGLDALVSTVVVTGDWGRAYWKPHARAFEEIERRCDPSGGGFVYVADNPSKDFVAPRRRGWLTVQVARPERVHRVSAPDAAYAAEHRVRSLDALDGAIAAWTGAAETPT